MATKRSSTTQDIPEKVNGTTTDRLLTASDIIKADDVYVERVDVPEWGGHIFVKLMSGTEKEAYVDSVRQLVGVGKTASYKFILKGSGAKLVAATACDDNGKRIFRDEDVEALGRKSHKAMRRVIDAAGRLNGLSDDADDDAKNDSAATVAKNIDSTTDSPRT